MIKTLNKLAPAQEYADIGYEVALVPSGSFYTGENSILKPTFQELCQYGNAFDEKELAVYNPMPLKDSVNFEVLDESDMNGLSGFLERYRNGDTRLIDAKNVDGYADKLFELGQLLQQQTANCTICPLRGALKPVMQLRLMNALTSEVDFLPFTGGASGEHDGTILAELNKIILGRQNDEELFSINIIDTAIGGHGCNKLADLLIAAQPSYSNSEWLVRFYLLHSSKANVSKMDSIRSKTKDDIRFEVVHITVDHLLVEDWDSALGVKLHFGSDYVDIKSSTSDGHIILKNHEKVQVVYSPNLSSFVDKVFADSVSECIETNPDLTFSHDVWQDYIER